MITKIKIPLLKHTKSKLNSLFLIGFLVLSTAFLLLLFIFDDTNNIIGKTFLIVIITYIILGIFIPKSRTIQCGHLHIDDNCFIYNNADSIIEKYYYKNIKGLQFIYSGFDGEIKKISGTNISSGKHNELMFYYNDRKIHFYVYLKLEYLPALKRSKKQLEQTGLTIAIKK
jgi:hypothetical protein